MVFFAPKTTDFIHLLKEITDDIKTLADLFQDFTQNFHDVKTYRTKAAAIEQAADSKVHNIICELHKTFITQLDREDIYALAHQLDDIVDMIENIIIDIDLYNITEKRPVIDAFTPLIVEAADLLEKTVRSLDEKKTDNITGHLIALHKLEDQGDTIYADTISHLFRTETDPITLIKWKKITEELESTMDKFQELSNTIEGITVKMS